MILYLVRHGIAIDRTDPHAPAEAERPLTRKGIEKTREAMLGLREMGVKPDAVISSPYLRAAQTAEIACEVFAFSREKVRHTNSLKPGSNPTEFVKELAHLKAKEVMCFGHAPNLDQLISHLAGAHSVFTSLKKAGVACIEMHSGQTGRSELQWILPPKVLRALS